MAWDAWEDRWKARDTLHEPPHRIECRAVDPEDKTHFEIETCKKVSRSTMSLSLIARLDGYPTIAVARYEVQNVIHTNPRWYSPKVIDFRVPHRHVYNVQAVRSGGTWEDCADPLAAPVGTLQQAIDRVTPFFLKDLNIDLHDPRVRAELFHPQ